MSDTNKIRVVQLVQTCVACPSQWDGMTDDGRKVYVRYRFAEGYVRVGAIGDHDEFAGVNGDVVAEFTEEGANEFDGCMSEERMKELTADDIEWAAPRSPEPER